MTIAASLFLASLFVPPAVVLVGIVVALWPAGLHARRDHTPRIEHAIAHR